MPDVTNLELKKLICMVLKKVELIEEKVNKVYEAVGTKIKIDPIQGTVSAVAHNNWRGLNCRFYFKPIKNEEELDYVTERFGSDENYRETLLNFMRNKLELKIEDVFSPEFLFEYNYLGVNGKKKLKGLVPFEQIFMEIKLEEGFSEEQILKNVKRDIQIFKDRLKRRKAYKVLIEEKKAEIDENNEESQDQDYAMKEETNFTTTNMTEEESFVSTIEDVPETTQNYVAEETPRDDNYYDNNAFEPIENDEQLQVVSNKLQNDSNFLKQTRIHLVNNSDDGECTLLQIFTEKYLCESINWSGKFEKKKLRDLIPYQLLYSYLKLNLGMSEIEIDKEAQIEVEKLKRRYSALARKRKIECIEDMTQTN